jgi:DNA-binding NtrC family response regulator
VSDYRILIVEDDEVYRLSLRAYLRSLGYQTVEAPTLAAAREAFVSVSPDAVVLDYELPDGNALELLPFLKGANAEIPVIIMTGHGSIDLAVRAIKEGAEHFLTKPVELPTLDVLLRRVLESLRDRRKLLASRQALDGRQPLDPFVGESASIRTLRDEATALRDSDAPLLIHGETGTGKSVLARWLHEHGPRADEAFVDFNCAGLARELVETEFFGHERGAFTGAVASKKGLLEVAHRGTVFLDEIGDMDIQIQPKLLKTLEEKRFRRVGDLRDRYVDVRIIAATNQDLPALVAARQFRADLLFRINTLPITIPPLRERGTDVLALARVILRDIALTRKCAPPDLAADAERALTSYQWPGNIRELRNVLERAVLLTRGGTLTAKDLRITAPLGDRLPPSAARMLSLDEAEREHIRSVVAACGGSVVEAAKVLGIARSSLYARIRRFDIPTSD